MRNKDGVGRFDLCLAARFAARTDFRSGWSLADAVSVADSRVDSPAGEAFPSRACESSVSRTTFNRGAESERGESERVRA